MTAETETPPRADASAPAQSPERGCLPRWLAKLFAGAAHSGDPSLPYRKCDSLLTRAELSFHAALRQAVDARWSIQAKARLADLLCLPKGTSDRQKHLNRIVAKHVDFVLCDSKTFEPLLAIELDDASHARADRARRDAFVEAALAAAGLPLLRIRAANSYAPSELRARFEDSLAKANRGDPASRLA